MIDFQTITDPEGIALYEANDFFRPFPKPEDVFATQVDKHFEYLLPIASVDLRLRLYDWEGTIHFVSPIEPFEGVVGAGTERFHNSYCSENWIGYKVIDDKLELATDFKFFQKENLTDFYKEIKAGYFNNLNFYKNHKCVYSEYATLDDNGKYDESYKSIIAHGLGGASFYGNWSSSKQSKIKILEKVVNEELLAYPLTEDGRKFEFIGKVSPYMCLGQSGISYIHDADILLFFDPIEQIILTTFDW